jgi:hypothetical protein
MAGESPGPPRLVRWVGIFFVACFIGLIPWTIYLWLTLPVREVSPHYNLAWTGFDVLLAIALLASGACDRAVQVPRGDRRLGGDAAGR